MKGEKRENMFDNIYNIPKESKAEKISLLIFIKLEHKRFEDKIGNEIDCFIKKLFEVYPIENYVQMEIDEFFQKENIEPILEDYFSHFVELSKLTNIDERWNNIVSILREWADKNGLERIEIIKNSIYANLFKSIKNSLKRDIENEFIKLTGLKTNPDFYDMLEYSNEEEVTDFDERILENLVSEYYNQENLVFKYGFHVDNYYSVENIIDKFQDDCFSNELLDELFNYVHSVDVEIEY